MLCHQMGWVVFHEVVSLVSVVTSYYDTNYFVSCWGEGGGVGWCSDICKLCSQNPEIIMGLSS